MRILTGTDIIEINRIKDSIESLGDSFKNKIYTEEEIKYCETRKNAKYQHYAGRFAAKEAIKKQKKENDQIGQLQQQVQQLTQQLQQAQQELQKAQQQVQQLNAEKLQLEKQKIESDSQINMYKAKTDRDYKEAEARNDALRTKVELEQLHDGNPYNDTIKQLH